MAITKAVLIVGGSGFVGTHLAIHLRERYKVFATYNENPVRIPGVTLLPVNLGNRNHLKRVVYTIRPEAVIYAAGSNDVDWAEANPREAESLHTSGAASVSNVAEIFQPKFIYLSNCYPFDGTRGNYHEGDTVLPVTALGKAKVGGENYIRGKALSYVIIRSSPLLARGNGIHLSFLDRLRMKLAARERIEVAESELHSFAAIDGLLEMIDRVLDSGLRNKTLHYGGRTKLSLYELSRLFAGRFGYDPELILAKKHTSGTTSNYELPRLDYSLNSTQTYEMLKIEPLLLEQSFDLIEKKLVARA
ncbi:MAG: sugar nucleotide-binding protein [Oligoflexia bacterium]|nr:sugar nucleotide-binding protein [Oligoflexia bacterium]